MFFFLCPPPPPSSPPPSILNPAPRPWPDLAHLFNHGGVLMPRTRYFTRLELTSPRTHLTSHLPHLVSHSPCTRLELTSHSLTSLRISLSLSLSLSPGVRVLACWYARDVRVLDTVVRPLPGASTGAVSGTKTVFGICWWVPRGVMGRGAAWVW